MGLFDCAAPPDTKPVADASVEATRLMKELGEKQLAQAKEQYNKNMEVATPVIDRQKELMDQTIRQGSDYYEYGKSFRDLEQQMKREASAGDPNDIANRRAIRDASLSQSKELAQKARDYTAKTQSTGAQLRAMQSEQGRALQNDVSTFARDQNAATNRMLEGQLNARNVMLNRAGVQQNQISESGRQLRDIGARNAILQMQRGAAFNNEQANREAELRSAGLSDAALLRARTDAYTRSNSERANELRNVGLANASELRRRTGAFESDAKNDIGLATGSDTGLIDRFGNDIEQDVGRAIADQRQGQSNAMRSAAIQAMRYGINAPVALTDVASQNALAVASAANNTREAKLDQIRNRLATGVGLKQNVFGQANSSLTDAMSRQEGALQNRITNDTDLFRTGMSSTEAAMNRRAATLQGGIDNAASRYATRTTSDSQAFDRQEGAYRGNLENMRSNYATTNQLMNDAYNREAAARQSYLNTGLQNFGTYNTAKTNAMNMRTNALRDYMNANKEAFTTGNNALGASYDRMIGAMSNARSQYIQDKSLDWAKKLDITGMARGMPGASQGAYGVSINAGNSAVNNSVSTSGQYMQGINQGNATIGSGQQMGIQGLSNVLNAQTSYANNAGSAGSEMFGALVGAGAKMYTASDPKLKTEVKKVGKDEKTGLNEYEYRYKGSKTKHRGVMADEVQDVDSTAVVKDKVTGFSAVDYLKLGLNKSKGGKA